MASVHPFIPRAELDSGVPLPLGQEVALPELAPLEATDLGGALQTPLGDGGWEINFDENEPVGVLNAEGAEEHYANLAMFLSEGELSSIAQDVEEMVKADLASRRPWYDRLAKGLELLGVIDEKGVREAFKGASTVNHPLIAEAIVQYQARAFVELFPATGPAKAIVMGARSREKTEQSDRVADYMNYQLTIDDESYSSESDRLLWLQPSDGSVFRKCYHDFLIGKNVARVIKAEHFVVPYSATTLEDAPRYTHLLYYTQNEMRRLQRIGFYRDCPLSIPASQNADEESQDLAERRDEQEGRTDPDLRPDDREHCVREMVVDYDLPRFQDKGEDGKPTGLGLPYVISAERDSLKILSIRRGWRESDPEKKRRIQVVHYPFIRGEGFYGYGFFHLVGGLGRAATGVLRAILDTAAFSGLQGGFKAKDGKLASEITIEPGVWKDVEMTYEELAKSFYTPPFKDVPVAMFNVLGLLTELGQRFANTTDATVGDAKNTGPVGTTIALIEQGQKVATGIHKRSHESLGKELRLISELNGEYLPADGYPYDVPGASRQIFREDFSPAVDVIPVSDPNIFSSTQRIAIAQTGLQLSDSAPDLYDRREAHRRMLEAMKVPDIDALMPPPAQIKRCDPVTENAKAMTGEPIKVFQDQHHDAHIAVHMGQLQMMVAQQSVSAQTFQQGIIPHIADHEAQSMRLKMMKGMGVSLPPLEETEDEEPQDLSPELETQIAMKAAEVMQALTAQLKQAQAQQQGQAPPGPDASAQEQADFEAEQKRRDEAFQRDESRKDVRVKSDIERQDAQTGIDPVAVKSAAQFLSERGLSGMITPRKLAVVSHELGKPFADTVRLLMAMRQAGQNMGPAPFAMPSVGGIRE